MLSVYQNFHFIDFIEGSLLKWSVFKSSMHMEYQYILSFIKFHFLLYLLTLVTFNVGGRRQRNKDLLRLDFRKLLKFFLFGNVNDANSKQNGRLNHDCEEMLNNIEIIRSIPQFWILTLIAWPCYWSYFWQP